MTTRFLAQQLQIIDPDNLNASPATVQGPLPTDGPQYNTLADVLNPILKIVFPLMLVVAFLLIVWAGFDLARSFGNPEALKKAQARLTNIIIGLVLLAMSYWLAGLVKSIFFP